MVQGVDAAAGRAGAGCKFEGGAGLQRLDHLPPDASVSVKVELESVRVPRHRQRMVDADSLSTRLKAPAVYRVGRTTQSRLT